jgi:hypothetical protein
MTEIKDIQKIYETTVLTGRSKAIDESRGGWMIGLIGDLEEAFNSDAGFYNGKYQPSHPMDTDQKNRYLSEKDHKAMVSALNSLVKTMQKGYKGKLIGF